MSSEIDAETTLQILDLVARHAALFDESAWTQFPFAYAEDATLGTQSQRAEPVIGAPIARWTDPAAKDPTIVLPPHHTTDTILHRLDARTIRAWSKYIALRADGQIGGGDYLDTLVLTDDGWRIHDRIVNGGDRTVEQPGGPSERVFGFTRWRSPAPAV